MSTSTELSTIISTNSDCDCKAEDLPEEHLKPSLKLIITEPKVGTDTDNSSEKVFTILLNHHVKGSDLSEKNKPASPKHKRKPIAKYYYCRKVFIAASLILPMIAALSVPIVVFYIQSPGLDLNVQTPDHVVNFQTCQGALNLSTTELNNAKMMMLMTNTCSNVVEEQDDLLIGSDALEAIYLVSTQFGNTFCQNAITSLYCNVTYSDEFECIENAACSSIRDVFCSVEWRLVEHVFKFTGPSSQCCNSSSFAVVTPSLNCMDQSVLTCNSVCQVSCKDFSQFNEDATKAVKGAFGFFGYSLIFGSVLVVILSVANRKTMFKFPQIYLLLSNVCLLILGMSIVLPMYIGHEKTFCSHPSLLYAFLNPTSLCQLFGFTAFSSLFTYSEFWFLHVVHVFLKLTFPFSAQKFENWRFFRVTVAIELAVVLAFGCIPSAIVAIRNEFNLAQFPALYCQPRNVSVAFYTNTFPLILLEMAGVSILVVMSMILQNHMQASQLHRSSALKLQLCPKVNPCYISVPVAKIMTVFISYTIAAVLNWVTFTTVLVNYAKLLDAIGGYGTCLAPGELPGLTCDQHRENMESLSYPQLYVLSYITAASLPYFSIIYIVEVRQLKYAFSYMFQKHNV